MKSQLLFMILGIIAGAAFPFGLPVKSINWPRVVGILFLITGVIMIRKF